VPPFSAALVTASVAANSFLILAFTFKKSTNQKLNAICCLSALAWVGERWTCGYFA
jgi:hypothetical protein